MGKDQDQMQVRDRRGPERYFIDNIFMRGGWAAAVGPYGIAVYDCLALHADADNQDAWPSRATIGRLTGMSSKTAGNKMIELAKHNIIKVESGKAKGRPNTVYLLASSEWRPVEGWKAGSQEVGSRFPGGWEAGSQEGRKQVLTNKTQETKPIQQDDNNSPLTPGESLLRSYSVDLYDEIRQLAARYSPAQIQVAIDRARGKYGDNGQGYVVLLMRGDDMPDQAPGQAPDPSEKYQRTADQVAQDQAALIGAGSARQAGGGRTDEVNPAALAWDEIKMDLQHMMTRATFNTWIKPTAGLELNGSLIVAVPNDMVLDWIENRLRKTIDRAARDVARLAGVEPVPVEFVVTEAKQ